MDAIAQSISDPKSRLNACDDLVAAFEKHAAADRAEARAWRLNQDDFLLSKARDVNREDAAVPAAAIVKRDNADWFRRRVLPFLVEQKGNSAFLLAFATGLFIETERGRFDQQTFAAAFERLWESIICDLYLPRDAERAIPPMLPSFVHYPRLPQPKNISLKPDDLLRLHRILSELGRDADVDNLMHQLQQEATVVHLDYMVSLVIPYLRGAIQLSKSRDIDMSSGKFQDMFCTCLRQYVERFVQMEPPHPTDWTKAEKGCKSCVDCTKVDAFLRSPTQTVEEFKADEKRRRHIEYRFDSYPRTPEFALSTHKDRRPFTLSVTKIHKDGELKLREWRTRAQQAKQIIASIATEHELRAILGDQYDHIVNLKLVTLAGVSEQAASTSNRRPMEPIHNVPETAQLAQTAGTKRKVTAEQENETKRIRIADVIDLT